jgi:hypothetical protein
MSADQQIINYGASANDGTGDPLRTAFIKTDDNFDSIWAAGPVGSNVVINGNTVRVVSLNGNLTLQANGVGSIQTSSSMLPRLGNTFDLGSADSRYRSLYVGPGGISVTGNVTGANINTSTSFGLPVFANTTVRDNTITSPQPGMMIFVTGTGMQVRGATAWNTVAGTAT